MPNHQLERVRMRMLCFQFTIVHRNSNMVKEVDLLTRYNKFANHFRTENDPPREKKDGTLVGTAIQKAPSIGASNIPIMMAGPPLAPRTEAASRWSRDMMLMLGSAGIGEVEMAVEMLGRQPVVVAAAEENDF